MNKLLFSLIAVGLSFGLFAQTVPGHKKRPSIGINFLLKDMKTADLIDHTSLSNVLSKQQWTKIKDMSPGLSLHYYDGLTEQIDFMGSLGGSYVKYPFSYFTGVTTPSDSKFFLEASASVNFKLLKDNHFMVPYVSVGLGAAMYSGNYFTAYFPTGIGLQFNLGEETYVNTVWAYNSKISDLTTNHYTYSIGIASPLYDKKVAPIVVAPPPPPPPPPPPAVDTDGDGIIDSKDKCPTVPGIAKYDGCPVPDTDGDGINDENDKCPTVKGVAKYSGCPVPDTDKDGINDEEDKCPNVAGVARYQGCPIPDKDGDGINDEEDKCPDVKGTAANLGCPEEEIRETRIRVFFATNKSVILPNSKPSLDSAVSIMKQFSRVPVTIEGHTDNTGDDKINLPLSQKRAEAVRDYLIKEGIDAGRLSAKGYGSSNPRATNNTAEGRAINRRVVMIGTTKVAVK